jgi:xylulokinase
MQVLGLDLGTTTLKAVVYSEDGTVLATAATPPPAVGTTVAGVPVDLWPAEELWSCVCGIVRDAVGQLDDPAVGGLAIVELGLVGLPVGPGGEALYPPVAWMNPPDPFSGMRRELIDERAMFASTGNRLNPIYPPVWISWLTGHDDRYPRAPWKWLNVGEYLSCRMTGEIAIDYSMASQTLLLDQNSLKYRKDLLEAMGLDSDLFPAPRNAGELLGRVRPGAAGELGLGAGTPVFVGGADFVTGSYASGMIDPGDCAIITGTWECTVLCSDRPETSWNVAEVGGICDRHIAPGRWSVRIETFSGDVTEWWRRAGFGGEAPVAWSDVIGEAASAVAGSGGVVFVPHLAGSYGPVLDERARGAFIGLTSHTTRSELTRAVFEGLCFQSRYALEALQDGLSRRASRIVTMGGATRNQLWMQTRADVLGTEVDVVTQPDVTPRGAAMIAGVGAGLFADFWEAARAWALDRTTLTPDRDRAAAYDTLYRDVFRPLCEQLTPFHHRLGDLSGTGTGDGAGPEPDGAT